jgi:hypothetical protein
VTFGTFSVINCRNLLIGTFMPENRRRKIAEIDLPQNADA